MGPDGYQYMASLYNAMVVGSPVHAQAIPTVTGLNPSSGAITPEAVSFIPEPAQPLETLTAAEIIDRLEQETNALTELDQKRRSLHSVVVRLAALRLTGPGKCELLQSAALEALHVQPGRLIGQPFDVAHDDVLELAELAGGHRT